MTNELGHNVSVDSLMRERFGFAGCLPGQREVMTHLLAGRSAAAVFPTGGGKSLCYQLPALVFEGVTLVVSPLIALMKDQIDVLVSRGIAAARLDSSLTAEAYREVMGGLRSAELRLLYVAPERFNNERFRAAIQRVPVSLFAVDEAHCISEWGHNFRPDYLKLARFARICRAERVLALTATATERVLADVCRLFDIAPECAVRTPFYRPNLTLRMTPVAADERDARLLEQLRERPRGPTIIYVTQQRTAESVAGALDEVGLEARAYHAGLKPDKRTAVQDWFMASDQAIVAATIAFGMGIDKSDIRSVYHYNLPKSLENYAQEIGRAGRDGELSVCEMFYCPDDLMVLENFAYGDTPSRAAVRGLVDHVFELGPDFDVSYYDLSRSHDIRLLVVRTLLTYLELEEYLEGGTPFYQSYRFKPLMSSQRILAQFDERRRTFLADLFRQASKARTWFSIDLGQAAAQLGVDRQRVVRALDYLAERQLLEVQTQGVRHRYRRLKQPTDLDALTDSLCERMLAREAGEIARLRQVVDLVAMDGCQVSALGAHFGQPLEGPCGHCSWCLAGGEPAALPVRHEPPIDADLVERLVVRVRSDDPGLPLAAEPRVLARFLCGLRSPAISRARVTDRAEFGALAQVSFPLVLRHVKGGLGLIDLEPAP